MLSEQMAIPRTCTPPPNVFHTACRGETPTCTCLATASKGTWKPDPAKVPRPPDQTEGQAVFQTARLTAKGLCSHPRTPSPAKRPYFFHQALPSGHNTGTNTSDHLESRRQISCFPQTEKHRILHHMRHSPILLPCNMALLPSIKNPPVHPSGNPPTHMHMYGISLCTMIKQRTD